MLAFGRRMVDNFGWRFLFLLASVYFGVKGLVYRISYAAFLPYLRHKLGVDDATRYQSLFTVCLLPWSLKPFLGMISDVLPIGGYHKRWYIQASVVVGVVACALLAAAPVGKVAGGAIAAVLFFFITAETAASDLLVEGLYSEKMVAVPESGSDMVTAVWSLYQAGAFFSAIVVAGVADRDPANFFWVCLPIAAQLTLPVGAGWLGETRVVGGFRWDKVSANGRYFALGSLMGVAAIGLGAVSLWASVLTQATYSIVASVVLCGLSLWWLPPMHGRAHVYMLLTSALNANIRGALDPFYTGDASCNPTGPQFDLRFYLSWSAAVGSVAGLAGIAIFQLFLARTWYRRAFWTTTLLQVAAGAMDILIVARVNLRMGISDKAAYLLGDSIVQDVVIMMDLMPQIVLLSKLCPPGMESVVYSLLAGCLNFGAAVASSVGSLAIDRFGIRTPADGAACTFDNLGWLIFFCHVCLPLLTVPLTFVLVPDAKMTDDLLPAADGGSGYELGTKNGGADGGASWGGDPAEPDTWIAPDEAGVAPPLLPTTGDAA